MGEPVWNAVSRGPDRCRPGRCGTRLGCDRGDADDPDASARVESRPGGPVVSPGASPSRPGSSKRPVLMWVGIAVLVFSLVPDLKASLEGSGAPIPYSWDTSNIIAWASFIRTGLTPMKDFFYPYGFQSLYELQSFGPLFEWLAEAGTLAVAGWSLWTLSGGRTMRVLACLLVTLVLADWAAGEIWRYLPALLVPVAYAAAGPASSSRLNRGHLALFLSCLLAVLIEPDLLLYGAVGAFLVLLGELVSGRLACSPRRIAVGLAWDATAVLASAVVLFLVWLATDTASGWLRFFGGFTAISAADQEMSSCTEPRACSRCIRTHTRCRSRSRASRRRRLSLGLLPAARDDRGVSAILLGAAGVALVMLHKSLGARDPRPGHRRNTDSTGVDRDSCAGGGTRSSPRLRAAPVWPRCSRWSTEMSTIHWGYVHQRRQLADERGTFGRGRVQRPRARAGRRSVVQSRPFRGLARCDHRQRLP